MQLWTDYEGVTIDGAFPLQELLLPEGRSAFFSTAGPNGEPMVVRLIECHFDEEEILARWRRVDALCHPNFLKFAHYGQTELDGCTVVYAVFENVDANLAGVLDEGHLTIKDVADLACSLVAALDVLHTHGFVHEHLEPRNIFAVGEHVKLRSDCIREAPEAEEGVLTKQRDVRDLAMVILQALTQQRSVEGVPDFAIPPPFGDVIRNGLDCTWDLEHIRTALGSLSGSKQPAKLKPVPAVSGTVYAALATPAVAEDIAASAGRYVDKGQYSEFARGGVRDKTWARKAAAGLEQNFSLRSRWLGAAGVVALVLVLSTWALAHMWHLKSHTTTPDSEAVVRQATQFPANGLKHAPNSRAPRRTAWDPSKENFSASPGPGASWRVVSFTYNRRADAEKKVSDLGQNHPELHPAVFTASGHAPYVVSIGGVMDRDAAYALARRSRSAGLPRDTYAQNYSH